MGVIVEFEALHNVRDLGGMSTIDGRAVKPGFLFRGDQPYFATDSDKKRMKDLGIAKVFDFRSGREVEEKPDPTLEGVMNIHLPIIQDVRAGITRDKKSIESVIALLSENPDSGFGLVDSYMQRMYADFVSNPFSAEQYARFVDETIDAAERGRAVFWHCTAGKDRAGFATVIMLESLGIARDDIVADYLITNERLTHVVDHLVDMVGKMLPVNASRPALRRFFRAEENYLAAAYDAADREYGGFDGFLEQALGVDEGKRLHMRSLFLQ